MIISRDFSPAALAANTIVYRSLSSLTDFSVIPYKDIKLRAPGHNYL